jgi:TubC N-terminal docking domain
MTPAELVADLNSRGITLTVNGDKLKCRGREAALTPELLETLREHKSEIMLLLSQAPSKKPVSDEADLPFPLGNGGLDPAQVEMAELHNARCGELDPVKRRLNVLFWLMQHYRGIGESKLADEVKEAYFSLRNAAPDVVALVRIGELAEETLLKRLRNGQWWLTEEHEKWAADNPDSVSDTDFQKALDGWVAMEAQLRGRHGYQGCIHGEGQRCPNDAVVNCDACAGE